MLSAQNTKICVLFGLLFLTFIFGMIPVKLVSILKKRDNPHRSSVYKIVFSLMSCYAAGVFLATCLLDLLPEVKEKVTEGLYRAEIYTSFPVSEFVMVFGLFIILITEQVVLLCKETHRPEYEPLNHFDHFHEHIGHHQHSYAAHSSEPHTPNTYSTNNYSNKNCGINNESTPVPQTIHNDLEDMDEDSDNELIRSRSQSQITGFYEDPSAHSRIRAVILLVALSLHSVFEGLAVGLQPTAASVIAIFAALSLHKCLLAFSLGLNLVQSSFSMASIIRSNLLFALTSPAGIAIGIGITDLTKDMVAASLVNGMIQGLACGTFLYVTFLEILPHEFNVVHHMPNRMLKLLFLILGYSTVVAILFINSTPKPSLFHG